MNEMIIKDIEQSMLNTLNNEQMLLLDKVLKKYLDYNINQENTNNDMIHNFIKSKRLEGCSARTIKYYNYNLIKYLEYSNKNFNQIDTNDLRLYLDYYQMNNNVSRISIDNIRRVLSSFFNWLEEENYIIKNPMKRIHKIKVDKIIKETYSDEMILALKDNVKSERDLAIIELLSSTGMRVGELVKLNIRNIDFENKECIVFGKGNKERKVFFDAGTKVHLKEYLNTRCDDNEALFVSLNKPYLRLQISGVEIMLRKLGKSIGLLKVHPHKFRRTLATKAIDKGMPIEQVQKLLGHSKIDTTLEYAMVDINNVKLSHKRYIS